MSMPPIRLFLFLANSFTFLPFSQSFLIASDRHIQFCYFRFKTHTMPLSPSSIVDFVDDNSQDGANIDTRAFPSDPNSSKGTARDIQETDDLIRVAVLGTGMMGQVRFRVCSCWWRQRVGFPFYFSIFPPDSCLLHVPAHTCSHKPHIIIPSFSQSFRNTAPTYLAFPIFELISFVIHTNLRLIRPSKSSISFELMMPTS